MQWLGASVSWNLRDDCPDTVFYEDADLIGMINLSRLINVGLLNQLLKEDIELNGFVFAPT